jgi:hypothetical protein
VDCRAPPPPPRPPGGTQWNGRTYVAQAMSHSKTTCFLSTRMGLPFEQQTLLIRLLPISSPRTLCVSKSTFAFLVCVSKILLCVFLGSPAVSASHCLALCVQWINQSQFTAIVAANGSMPLWEDGGPMRMHHYLHAKPSALG